MANHLRDTQPDARLIFASSEKDSNLLYATRFFAPDAYIFFESRGESHLVMSDLEIDRARKQASVDHIHSFSEVENAIRRSKKVGSEIVGVLKCLFSQEK